MLAVQDRYLAPTEPGRGGGSSHAEARHIHRRLRQADLQHPVV